MGPGTAEVDVEGVAVFGGGEFRVGIFGDEVAECAGLATELAVGVGVFVDGGLGGGSVSWFEYCGVMRVPFRSLRWLNGISGKIG